LSKNNKYIDVILPLPVKGVFQYSYSKNIDLKIGQRVIVQFGVKKLYTAIVFKLYDHKTIDYAVKPIESFINELPIVNNQQIEFWLWISKYYLCELGEVMNASLPSSLKLASESKFVISPDFDGDLSNLNDIEKNIFKLFNEKTEISLSNLKKNDNNPIPFSSINNLIRQEILISYEDINDKYSEKLISFIEINAKYDIDSFSLTTKQKILYSQLISCCELYSNKRWTLSQLIKKLNTGRSIFNALISKDLLFINKQPISRLLNFKKIDKSEKTLSFAQDRAYEDIKHLFISKDVCLLHGVTSSGKTEVYFNLINDQVEKGRQVLYLLPEIALTIQIIERLRDKFGDNVGVFHSKLNNSQRVEVWKSVQTNNTTANSYSIILGARSSLFLPFDNLGLIIVDEEHDSSFKQQQPSPRYNARDSAIYLASIHNAKVVLGSATPSIESYFNAKNNKYGFVELLKRFSEIKLPKINIVDIRKAYLKKEMNGVFF